MSACVQMTLMCTYMTKAEYKNLTEVPDPYFGGPEGFEKVSRVLAIPAVLMILSVWTDSLPTEVLLLLLSET